MKEIAFFDSNTRNRCGRRCSALRHAAKEFTDVDTAYVFFNQGADGYRQGK
ncbi:MAG: hypothetical protein H7A13_08950 [Pseudomonadales bacterium]|nr:hypothetical protein [Pseudomonadales bacterium]